MNSEPVVNESEFTKVTFFSSHSKKVKDRLKFSYLIGGLLDDISELEQNVGKQLMKAFEGSRLSQFEKLVAGQSINKTDKWPQFQATCDNVLKSFTTAKGKFHLNLHTTLTSNVSKTLQEHYKSSNKSIQVLVSRIQTLSDDLRKTKQQYQRRIEKYGRIVVEAETTISSRDALNESMAPRSGGDSKERDILAKVKILTKTTPEDNLKRLTDKCREQLLEVEAQEAQLHSQSGLIQAEQAALREEVVKAMNELLQVEEGHISYLKDRKINLHLALDLLLAHFSESVEELVFDVEKLEVLIPPVSLPAGQRTRSPAVSESQDRGDVEVNDGNSEPVVNSSQLDDFDLTGLASDVKKSNLDGLLAQVENTIDHIEYVRSALQRIVTSVTEAIDIERNYCKSLIKLFTKNGYTSDIASISESRTSLIAQQSMNPDKFFSAQLMSQVISELLANFEGSMLKSAWLKAIDNMVRLAHFHLKALDSFPKEINDGFLPILSRLHHTRESLQDRKVNVAKQDLASRHMVHRVAQRLLKIQAQIAEKRAEIKRYDQLPTNSGQSIEMLSLATNSGKSALQADEDDPLNAITNTSTSTDTNGGAGKLKSYTALSVAVGLESHEERKVRLTARTAELEENEREAKTALDSALKACAQFEATATSDLVSLTNSTNQNLSMDLGQVRSIFLQLAQGQRDGIAHVKTMQYEVHEAWDKVDPAHECLLFYRVDFEAYDRQKHQPGVERINSGNSDSVFGSDLLLGDSGENIVMLADVAPMASFSPSHSELLGQERATLHLRELRGANDTKDTDDFGDLIDTTKKNSPRDGTGNTSGFPSDTATPIRKISPQKSPARLSKVGSIDAVIPEYELKAFGLQSIEKVLYSCSAALYSKKGLGLTQGRLYITKFFVAYQGWPETRLLLRFSDILTFEKSNTLIYIPNAILIKIKSDEYFFGSLIERDNAYNMLMNLWNVATTVYQSEDPAHSYHQSLVYGLQKDSVQELMTGIDSQITQLTEVAAPPTKPTRPVKVSLPEATQSPVTLTATSTPTAGASTISAPASFTTTASPLVTSPVAVKVVTSSKSSASETQQSIQAPSVATVPTPTVAAGPTSTVAAVDFLGAFRKANLEVMLRQTVAHSADDLWRCFFKDAQGFRNFLEVEGDFDIRTSEWVNLPAGQLRCPEDPCKLPFTQSRDFNFLHKRTTMLFIGPKNAPMAQTHYCNVDRMSDGSVDTVTFLTVTQLDGIPFSDCFKVLQYWVCTRGADPQRTAVTCAVGVHFIKSTMMKGNITSGVREEMIPQVKRLFASLVNNIVDYAILSSVSKSAIPSAVEQPILPVTETTGRRRSVSSSLAMAAAAAASSSKASEETDRKTGGVLSMFEDRTFTMTVVGVLSFIVLYQFYSNSVILGSVSNLTAKIDKLESAIKAFMSKQS